MERRLNYTVVGVFVVTLVVVMIGLAFWLSTDGRSTNYRPYSIITSDNVTGLSERSPVRFNGVLVGYVAAIQLDPSNPLMVRITVAVKQGTPVMTTTFARFEIQGITGMAYVALQSKGRGEFIVSQPGATTYPVIPVKPSLLMQLSSVLPNVAKTVDGLSQRVENLLSQDNVSSLSAILKNLDNVTSVLSSNAVQMKRSLASLDETLQGTAKASQSLPSVMNKLDRSLDQVSVTSVALTRGAKQVRRVAKSSSVLVDQVSQQTLPQVQVLSRQLSVLMSGVHDVVTEMHRNPAMLIRGKQAAEAGPGE